MHLGMLRLKCYRKKGPCIIGSLLFTFILGYFMISVLVFKRSSPEYNTKCFCEGENVSAFSFNYISMEII